MDIKKKRLSDTIQSLSEKQMFYKMKELEKLDMANFTLSYFHYVHTINELECPTFTELATKLNLSKPAVTAIVNKLIPDNIVYKERSNIDKRIYYIYLTEKGLKIAKAYKNAHLSFVEDISKSLCDEEYEQLIYLLNKIV